MTKALIPHFDHILQAAVESFLHGVAVADLDGRLLYVNPSFLSLWQLDHPEDALGQSALAFWTEPEVAGDVIQALKHLGQWQGELSAKRRDGSRFPVAVYAHRIDDPAGKPGWLMASFVDVSEQRQTINTLAELARQLGTFRRLTESAGQAIGMADAEAKIVYANPALRRLLGLAPERDLAGFTFFDFYSGEDTLKLVEEVLPAVQSEGEWLGEIGINALGGESRRTIQNVFMLRDEDNQAIAYANVITDITSLRRTEAMLQHARDNLNAAQELAKLGSWELDLIDDKLTWSAEIFRIFEIDADAFGASYEAFLAVVHPDDRELVNRAYTESVRQRQPYDYTHRLLMPDGRIKYVNERGETFYNEHGVAVRSFGTVQDITETHLARQALQDREEQIRLLLESTAEAIYGTDTTGLCTFVNTACVRVLGYADASELVGKPIHGMIHHHYPDGRAYPREECRAYQAYVRNAPTHVDDEVFWRKDGSAFPVEYWAHPVHQRGEVVGAVVTFFDVSERREADRRLRQSAAVFDNAVEGIMITDPKARIIAVNQAFSHITGYTEAEVVGLNPRFLQSGRHDAAFYAGMWQELNASDHWQGEIWNRRKSGEVFAELLSINAVRDVSGNIVNYVSVFSDITRLKQFEAELEHRAHYDALTGLPNRLLLNSRLEHALEHGRRHGHKLGILFMDLDRFKNINDTLGHPMGDALLQGFAQRLLTRIRGDDTVARLGGDEFVVLLENLHHAEEAALVAQDILELMQEPFRLGNQEVFIGTSIGISTYPTDGNTPEALIKHADTALYQAKEQGRGTYRFYTEHLTQSANARLALETRLRHAMQKKEFALNYQPIYDIDGRIVAVEALCRWHHPEDGTIPPDHFIPIAEETGLIVPLGEWILEAACRQAVAWQKAGLAVGVAVNLSARQFQQANLLERVQAIVRKTGIDPHRLELEITESGMLARGERSAELMDALKTLGVSLSIDDFGTGYSSLAYLKRLPVDKLKIDRSFVRDIPTDSSDMEIAATIIAMAKNLGLKVLAEGVETQAQLDFLRQKGCDYYQGYYYSRPLPADAVGELLAG
jgi:diguanylate cyclase (GGDEF)-like protein/PAS domain S-box-containing protein